MDALITKVQTVYHVVDDVAAAAAFYRDALNLPLSFIDENKWGEFKVGETRFALSSREEAALGANEAVIVFHCIDSGKAEQQIAAHGGRVIGARDMGAHGKVVRLLLPNIGAREE